MEARGQLVRVGSFSTLYQIPVLRLGRERIYYLSNNIGPISYLLSNIIHNIYLKFTFQSGSVVHTSSPSTQKADRGRL